MKTRRHRGRPCIGLALLSLALGGCSSLLPTAKKEVVSAWTTYDDGLALTRRAVQGVLSSYVQLANQDTPA